MTGNTRGALLALGGFALYAAHDALIKSLGVAYAPFQIVFFSALISFPMASVMLLGDKQAGTLRPIYPVWTAIRTVVVVATAASAFYAFSALPLATVYAILFAAPLIITILSIPILGEVVRLRRWVAVLIGLAGVLIVLRPGTTEFGLGHLAALIAAIGSASASVIVRRVGREERSMVMLLYPMVGNVCVMGAILPFVYEPMPLDDLLSMAAVSALGFMAMLAMLAAYRAGEAVVVAPMQYSQILWAVLYGAFFFSELPDIWTLIGASVVIASGVYILLRESRADVPSQQPVLSTRSRMELGTQLRVGLLLRRRRESDTTRG
jgi:drug/metabolite transporter (DMT)-like permease